jgi:hypothetical protein
MRDELSLEMRRLVDQARRAEAPLDAGLKRRVRHAVALGIPTATILGTSLVAASGTAVSTGTGAAVGIAAVGKASAGLLNGFLAWVAGGFAIGIGATTAYVSWHGANQPARPALSVGSGLHARQPAVAPVRTFAGLVPAESAAPAATPESMAPTPAARTDSMQAAGAMPNVDPAVTGAQASNEARQAPSLADEVALLARVQKKLRDGQGAAALDAIGEAERRFAHSQLDTDFQAARVLAWCEVGQITRARQAADAFLRVHGSSPLVQRVRHSCAFSDTGAEPSSVERAPDVSENGNGR